ncbi:MAG: EamA family transporter [Cyanobacteria bacterium P01_D01_bin.105]
MQSNDSSNPETSHQESLAQGYSASPDASALTPVEALQTSYADQLSRDIEQLEDQKAKLRKDIQTLTRAYTRLQASVESLRRAERSASSAADAADERVANQQMTAALRAHEIDDASADASATDASAEWVRPTTPLPSPRLPGESTTQPSTQQRSSIELPIPATSAQRRQIKLQSRRIDAVNASALQRRGLVLGVIATVLMVWHFCAIAALATGGSWLGFSIGRFGTGFMPAVALLWLRMLVVVPVLVLISPQLYENVWEDLQEWTYSRDGLLLLLIGSGVALFVSQVLLYQCLGFLGPTIGIALLFLYPLTAIPLGIALGENRNLSALAGLALVAIAMGAVLTLKPTFQSAQQDVTAIWLGLATSVAFSVYIILTNLSYRQQRCHPIPAGLVQFCVVAALSSIVLLVRPIEPAEISWLSLAIWGILLGLMMLLVYLFNYSSLRLIGSRTTTIAAAAPLIALVLAWSFYPAPRLAIIQWTGIVLIGIGGMALGKEKVSQELLAKERLSQETLNSDKSY